jgi:hypothetical protein
VTEFVLSSYPNPLNSAKASEVSWGGRKGSRGLANVRSLELLFLKASLIFTYFLCKHLIPQILDMNMLQFKHNLAETNWHDVAVPRKSLNFFHLWEGGGGGGENFH